MIAGTVDLRTKFCTVLVIMHAGGPNLQDGPVEETEGSPTSYHSLFPTYIVTLTDRTEVPYTLTQIITVRLSILPADRTVRYCTQTDYYIPHLTIN